MYQASDVLCPYPSLLLAIGDIVEVGAVVGLGFSHDVHVLSVRDVDAVERLRVDVAAQLRLTSVCS